MFTVIHCSQCDSEGMFKLSLKVDIEVKSCPSCRHINVKNWTFYFCDMVCMLKWLKKNKYKISCQDCRETGYESGFKENGICKTCLGKKMVEIKRDEK